MKAQNSRFGLLERVNTIENIFSEKNSKYLGKRRYATAVSSNKSNAFRLKLWANRFSDHLSISYLCPEFQKSK